VATMYIKNRAESTKIKAYAYLQNPLNINLAFTRKIKAKHYI